MKTKNKGKNVFKDFPTKISCNFYIHMQTYTIKMLKTVLIKTVLNSFPLSHISRHIQNTLLSYRPLMGSDGGEGEE